MSKRRNGEASVFHYRNGYAAYAWVTTPEGERKRKWVYGKTHDEVHEKWIKLQTRASAGPMPTTTPMLASYLAYWLQDVVEPNLAPKTTERYALLTRLYLIPGLGAKRLDRLQVRDIRTWLNQLRTTCQCCAQGKDGARPADRRCCAIGACCHQVLSERTVKDIPDVLQGRARQCRRRGAPSPQRCRSRTAPHTQETAAAMVVGGGSPSFPGIRPPRPRSVVCSLRADPRPRPAARRSAQAHLARCQIRRRRSANPPATPASGSSAPPP